MNSTTASSLVTAFSQVPDPRRRQGRRFELASLLAVAVAAMLANHRSVLAMAEWAADQSPTLLRALGFADGVTPHQSTLARVFARLDPEAVTAAVTAYLHRAKMRPDTAPSLRGCAIDGKAQRTRQAYVHPPTGVVQMLNAICHQTGIVIGQHPVAHHVGKVEAELTVAPALLAKIELAGRVITADALYCQRNLCQQIVDAGGDYLILVKANQPELFTDLQLLFDPPTPGPVLLDQRQARTIDHAHNRSADTRVLTASTDLNDYLDWPGIGQVFRLERTWHAATGRHRTIRYGITSLTPAAADAEQLLALRRGHWQIENRLHYVCDVSLGEDACTVRLGAGPIVMSLLRAAVVSLLRHANYPSIAAALRHFSRRPHELLDFLNLEAPENA